MFINPVSIFNMGNNLRMLCLKDVSLNSYVKPISINLFQNLFYLPAVLYKYHIARIIFALRFFHLISDLHILYFTSGFCRTKTNRHDRVRKLVVLHSILHNQYCNLNSNKFLKPKINKLLRGSPKNKHDDY